MPSSRVSLAWSGEGLLFRGGAPDRPQASLDGDSKSAASPVDALLLSLAGCMGADLVSILEKSRFAFTGLDIDVVAERAETHPRRVTGLHLTFRIEGGSEGQRAKVDRAVDLSRDTYCSVLHSLNPDIDLKLEVEMI